MQGEKVLLHDLMWPSRAEPPKRKGRADSFLENTLYICSGRGRRKEGIEKEEEIHWPILSSLCLR